VRSIKAGAAVIIQRMARSYRLGRGRRLVNAFVKRLLRLGLAGRHTFLLTVPGRSSGRLCATPVILVENGDRFLVAPYGAVGWVKNLRASGRATLGRRGQRQAITVRELAPAESAPVLREYLRRVRAVRPFFDASPHSPLEAFAAEAERHPVFRIETTTAAAGQR
jgi:deazaflavin-dependent oxidoreductase (nitroreductase family)